MFIRFILDCVFIVKAFAEEFKENNVKNWYIFLRKRKKKKGENALMVPTFWAYSQFGT